MSLLKFEAAITAVDKRAQSGKKSVEELNGAIAKADFSAGFQKLLEFKDAQGETGGTTFSEAWKILNAHLDRIEQARNNPANAHLQIYVAQATNKLEDFFRRFYGQLGDVNTLLKNLERFRKSEEAAAKSKQFGGGQSTTQRTATSSTSSGSLTLNIFQKLGGLP